MQNLREFQVKNREATFDFQLHSSKEKILLGEVAVEQQVPHTTRT